VAEDTATLAIGFAPGDCSTSVTRDLILPVQGKCGSTILWQSNKPEIISESGKVSRPIMPRWLVEWYLSGENPVIEKQVHLTATVTRGDASDARTYNLTVTGRQKLVDTFWVPMGAIEDGVGTLRGVAAGESLWVAVGDYGAVYTSSDGFSWTRQDAGIKESLRAVAFNGRMWVAVGDHFFVSSDGIKWNKRSTSLLNPYLVGVAGSPSLWVAIERYGFIFTSKDGYDWEWKKEPGTFNAVVWNGEMWIITGDEGLILTSSNGLNWTEQVSGTTDDLYDVAWDGSQWVVAGLKEILTSPDGVVWKRYDCFDAPTRIAWGGSQWVGFPSIRSNYILTSSNGTNWDHVIKDPTGFLFGAISDIASYGHRCVAVGEEGIVHVIDSVDFLDPGLAAAVRESLNEPYGAITREDIKGLQQMDASYRNIRDLAKLEFAINLVSLNLTGNRIENIREIENLQNLKYLNLVQNHIRDISPLIKNSDQGGLGRDSIVDLRNNPLDLKEGSQAYQDIARLISRGVTVIYGNDWGTITGKARCEKRNDHSGIVLTLEGTDTLAGTRYTATTVADGLFSFTDLEPGTYILTASLPGFLKVGRTVTVAAYEFIDLGELLLLAGDISRDNVVDIDDVILLKKTYATIQGEIGFNLVADFDANGRIGLIDLVLLARNYTKEGYRKQGDVPFAFLLMP